MRTHKYRGLRTDSRKWVYGSLVRLENQYVKGGIECWILPSTAKRPKDYDVSIDGTITGFVPVRPETVGLSTGLKDKKGQYCWQETALMEPEDGQILFVDWHDRFGQWYVYAKTRKGSIITIQSLHDALVDGCIVVDDVHIHPDLLEAQP